MVERKKNITSVHFRTGFTDSAYAAGMATTSTMMVETTEAISELNRYGQGLCPDNEPKNSR